MAYQPNQNPTWAERDGLDPNDSRRIIKGADFGAEFDNIKAVLDDFSSKGIVASCKFNGTSIMYQEGVSSVAQVGSGGYRVNFTSDIPGFDNHYAPIVTPFVSSNGLPVVVALTGFTDSWVEFTMTEFDGNGNSSPAINTGFSLLIVDMVPAE